MTSRLVSTAAALGLLALAITGCSKKTKDTFLPNIPPEVRLTQAPVSTGQGDQSRFFYAYRMNWVGYDPDGRVDYFYIAVDPNFPDRVDTTTRGGQPVWQKTTKLEQVVFFRSTTPDSTHPPAPSDTAIDFHTFAVAAVDNDGALSKTVWRAFTSFTIAPHVEITSPRTNPNITAIVTPSVRIQWTGTDPDGQFTVKPVKYKFKLFRPRDPDFPGVNDPIAEILSNPNLIRWKYAPTFGPSDSCPICSYWDSLPGDTTEVQYTNLVPNNIYAFAVTGFDEAGAYDPIFSQNSNLLKFAVTFAGTLGPQICMFNDFFNFCYASGGYSQDPSRWFNVEVPAGQTVTFNWFANPPQGADIRRYRWVLDLQDLTNETPRTDEVTDWYHWSSYSLNTTSATIGPFFNNGEIHFFYIEAEDNNGLRSLGIIRFTVVKATFDKDLLFVNDTRLTPDGRSGTKIDPPRGPWPTAAELDTFFFARGGFSWQGYPAGTLSPPGIFSSFGGAGVDYDTMGTRGITSGIVPLARLGQYRTVVWYVDDIGSAYTGTPTDLLAPSTSLRLMSSPGNPSTISTYMKQGGRVWLFGGGAAYATLSAWNRRNTPLDEFDNTPDAELVAGRFMYDFAHWQSALMLRPSGFALFNSPEFRPPWDPRGLPGLAAAGRGWTNHGMNHDLNQPDYNKLHTNVPFMGPRSCAADPPSPLRDCSSAYILTTYTGEFMGVLASATPNFIIEDADPNPDVQRDESTLDTLYFEIGGTAPYGRPVMTYYHGFQSPQMVFSGFPLWYFSKAQARGLGDFVLSDIFGLSHKGTPTAPARVRAAATPASSGQSNTVSVRRTAAPQRR